VDDTGATRHGAGHVFLPPASNVRPRCSGARRNQPLPLPRGETTTHVRHARPLPRSRAVRRPEQQRPRTADRRPQAAAGPTGGPHPVAPYASSMSRLGGSRRSVLAAVQPSNGSSPAASSSSREASHSTGCFGAHRTRCAGALPTRSAHAPYDGPMSCSTVSIDGPVRRLRERVHGSGVRDETSDRRRSRRPRRVARPLDGHRTGTPALTGRPPSATKVHSHARAIRANPAAMYLCRLRWSLIAT
jgi:hypothetical protein